MTNGHGQKVSLERGDFWKMFGTIALAVAIPIGTAMLITWRDVAVLRTQIENIAQIVADIKMDMRSLKSVP